MESNNQRKLSYDENSPPVNIRKTLFSSPQQAEGSVDTSQSPSSLVTSLQIQHESPFNFFRIKKKVRLSPDGVKAFDKDVFNSLSLTSTRTPLAPLLNKKSPMKKYLSCDKPAIEVAVQKSMHNPNLIGDFSQICQLATISGSHPDLNCITPEMMVSVLNGNQMKKYYLFDCRYPYEYLGGHIQTAQNFYRQDDIIQYLFLNEIWKEKKNTVLFFYCEFSSKRAPDMIRFVRNKDREMNSEFYPALYYPEMYLVEGGYQAFFGQFKEYCKPPEYKKMLDENCAKELALCRGQCKSKKPVARFSKYRSGLKF